MKKFKIRHIVFAGIVLGLLFNDGNKSLIVRLFEQRKLGYAIKHAQCQNDLLKKRIYYLENEPLYLERIVRDELNVIASGEIEYRFSVKD